MASNAENVSIWWRHHVNTDMLSGGGGGGGGVCVCWGGGIYRSHVLIGGYKMFKKHVILPYFHSNKFSQFTAYLAVDEIADPKDDDQKEIADQQDDDQNNKVDWSAELPLVILKSE